MSVFTRLGGAIVGVLGVVTAGCLDDNPIFAEPTEGGGTSSGATSTGGPPTTSPPTTSPPTTSDATTSDATTTDGSATTVASTGPGTEGSSGPPPPTCGDDVLDPGEECDDGPGNGDDKACTSACTAATCGDGLVWADAELCDDGNLDDSDACLSDCFPAFCGDQVVQFGVEECDDGNLSDSDACLTSCVAAKCGDGHVLQGVEMCDDFKNGDFKDGCFDDCTAPPTCNEIKLSHPGATDGLYAIDPDGVGPLMPITVECDMTTAGGGWTIVEKSPDIGAIGKPLYADFAVNLGNPLDKAFRLPKVMMSSVMAGSNALRIDCKGNDYLLTTAGALFTGEGMPGCEAKVKYTEAKLGIFTAKMVDVCTQLRGPSDLCKGAWGIAEKMNVGPCAGLPVFPWMQQVLEAGQYAFAMDSGVKNEFKHDCHKPGAVRRVMLK